MYLRATNAVKLKAKHAQYTAETRRVYSRVTRPKYRSIDAWVKCGKARFYMGNDRRILSNIPIRVENKTPYKNFEVSLEESWWYSKLCEDVSDALATNERVKLFVVGIDDSKRYLKDIKADELRSLGPSSVQIEIVRDKVRRDINRKIKKHAKGMAGARGRVSVNSSSSSSSFTISSSSLSPHSPGSLTPSSHVRVNGLDVSWSMEGITNLFVVKLAEELLIARKEILATGKRKKSYTKEIKLRETIRKALFSDAIYAILEAVAQAKNFDFPSISSQEARSSGSNRKNYEKMLSLFQHLGIQNTAFILEELYVLLLEILEKYVDHSGKVATKLFKGESKLEGQIVINEEENLYIDKMDFVGRHRKDKEMLSLNRLQRMLLFGKLNNSLAASMKHPKARGHGWRSKRGVDAYVEGSSCISPSFIGSHLNNHSSDNKPSPSGGGVVNFRSSSLDHIRHRIESNLYSDDEHASEDDDDDDDDYNDGSGGRKSRSNSVSSASSSSDNEDERLSLKQTMNQKNASAAAVVNNLSKIQHGQPTTAVASQSQSTANPFLRAPHQDTNDHELTSNYSDQEEEEEEEGEYDSLSPRDVTLVGTPITNNKKSYRMKTKDLAEHVHKKIKESAKQLKHQILATSPMDTKHYGFPDTKLVIELASHNRWKGLLSVKAGEVLKFASESLPPASLNGKKSYGNTRSYFMIEFIEVMEAYKKLLPKYLKEDLKKVNASDPFSGSHLEMESFLNILTGNISELFYQTAFGKGGGSEANACSRLPEAAKKLEQWIYMLFIPNKGDKLVSKVSAQEAGSLLRVCHVNDIQAALEGRGNKTGLLVRIINPAHPVNSRGLAKDEDLATFAEQGYDIPASHEEMKKGERYGFVYVFRQKEHSQQHHNKSTTKNNIKHRIGTNENLSVPGTTQLTETQQEHTVTDVKAIVQPLEESLGRLQTVVNDFVLETQKVSSPIYAKTVLKALEGVVVDRSGQIISVTGEAGRKISLVAQAISNFPMETMTSNVTVLDFATGLSQKWILPQDYLDVVQPGIWKAGRNYPETVEGPFYSMTLSKLISDYASFRASKKVPHVSRISCFVPRRDANRVISEYTKMNTTKNLFVALARNHIFLFHDLEDIEHEELRKNALSVISVSDKYTIHINGSDTGVDMYVINEPFRVAPDIPIHMPIRSIVHDSDSSTTNHQLQPHHPQHPQSNNKNHKPQTSQSHNVNPVTGSEWNKIDLLKELRGRFKDRQLAINYMEQHGYLNNVAKSLESGKSSVALILPTDEAMKRHPFYAHSAASTANHHPSGRPVSKVHTSANKQQHSLYSEVIPDTAFCVMGYDPRNILKDDAVCPLNRRTRDVSRDYCTSEPYEMLIDTMARATLPPVIVSKSLDGNHAIGVFLATFVPDPVHNWDEVSLALDKQEQTGIPHSVAWAQYARSLLMVQKSDSSTSTAATATTSTIVNSNSNGKTKRKLMSRASKPHLNILQTARGDKSTNLKVKPVTCDIYNQNSNNSRQINLSSGVASAEGILNSVAPQEILQAEAICDAREAVYEALKRNTNSCAAPSYKWTVDSLRKLGAHKMVALMDATASWRDFESQKPPDVVLAPSDCALEMGFEYIKQATSVARSIEAYMGKPISLDEAIHQIKSPCNAWNPLWTGLQLACRSLVAAHMVRISKKADAAVGIISTGCRPSANLEDVPSLDQLASRYETHKLKQLTTTRTYNIAYMPNSAVIPSFACEANANRWVEECQKLDRCVSLPLDESQSQKMAFVPMSQMLARKFCPDHLVFKNETKSKTEIFIESTRVVVKGNPATTCERYLYLHDALIGNDWQDKRGILFAPSDRAFEEYIASYKEALNLHGEKWIDAIVQNFVVDAPQFFVNSQYISRGGRSIRVFERDNAFYIAGTNFLNHGVSGNYAHPKYPSLMVVVHDAIHSSLPKVT